MIDAPKLTNPEWTAVAVALQDAHRCGCTPSAPADRARLIARIIARIFGPRRQNGLADPRLEAVRRFVCTTARRRRADEMAPALEDHGFSPAQIDALALLSA